MSSDIDELISRPFSGDINQSSLVDELLEIGVFVISSAIIGLLIFSLIGAIVSVIITGNFLSYDDFGGNIAFIAMIITGIYAALGFLAGRGTYYGEMQRRAWTGASGKYDDAQRDLMGFITQSTFMYRLFIGSVVSLMFFYLFRS